MQRTAHLALPRGDGFRVVPTVEAINAALELVADQGFVLPATLRIRQAHPLAQVLGLIGRCWLATVSYFIQKN